MMPEEMPGAMPEGCSEQYTQRNATDGRNVRHQDPEENPSVPDPRTPVDNPEFVPLGDAFDEALRAPMDSHERLPVFNHEPRVSPGRNRDLWAAIVSRDGPRCWMCRRLSDRLVLDHLRPRSNFSPEEIGLADRSDNLRIACWSCNEEKSNRLIPFDPPLPIVWTCNSAGVSSTELRRVYCAQHRHETRVPADWPIAGLRGGW